MFTMIILTIIIGLLRVNPFDIPYKNSIKNSIVIIKQADIIKQSIMNTETRIQQRFAFYFI